MPLNKQDNSAMARDEVIAVQNALQKRGFDPGPVDGLMGPRTGAAVMAFKRSIGFRVRPWVGPKTWAALMADDVDAEPGPTQGDLPPWIERAMSVLGLHESRDNSRLAKWLRSDGHALGDPARLPWCGDFVETAMRLALPAEAIPANPYWALNWRKFGRASTPCLGAVASITRNGGGHVGFVVGEDFSRFYLLGGNQKNTVSIAPIDKSRFPLGAFRWPKTYYGPLMPLRPMTGGASVSQFL